jgi:hypothetical protein
MAHYAEIDDKNIVIRVIVIPNEAEPTEQAGIDYCHNLFGGRWLKTSYNNNIRRVFASPGFYYDQLRDEFIPPRPYPSWVFDNASHSWQPPVMPPNDHQLFYWDEYTKTWIIYEE